MKALVVGLGSMGKRRIRCLKSLGIENIHGVDLRADRRDETREKYNIPASEDLQLAITNFKPDVMIISTPPDHHFVPAAWAVDHCIPCFIEASVIASDVAKMLEHCEGGSLIAPSCTMRYFEGPKAIKLMINGGVIGKPLNINYHVGQYLPDWHPNENIADFYVSKRETGACREIVPFEITWLNDIFGDPEPLACVKAKLSDLSIDIDDVYHCIIRYSDMLANLTVEVLARHGPVRQFCAVGSKGILRWSKELNVISYRSPDLDGERVIYLSSTHYDKPYEDEIRDFLGAVKGEMKWPNTLADDYRVLRTLERLEALS